MNEKCKECGCETVVPEYLDETQTGKANLRTKINHCTNCGSNPSEEF